MGTLTIADDNACCFLPTMLQGVQREKAQPCDIPPRRIHTEYTALFVWTVFFPEIDI